VDTGGTFTDCLAVGPDGRRHRAKVLSIGVLRARWAPACGDDGGSLHAPWLEDVPDGFLVGAQIDGRTILSQAGASIRLDGSLMGGVRTVTIDAARPAPILAAHLVTATPLAHPLPPLDLRLATTRGTNALLTRTGIPPAFFVTAGFEDLLRIGDQHRPDLFALDIVRPEPLTGPVVGVHERVAAEGTVIRPLDEDAVRAGARLLRSRGVTTAAVALLHAVRNPEHEQRVATILCEEGFSIVRTSAALAPFIHLLARAQTAVTDAYLAPILNEYLGDVQAWLPDGSRLLAMTSAGGLVPAERYAAKDSLLSGPAGGMVGAAAAGRAAGYERLLAFDMGGTSTDVSRIAGAQLDYVFTHRVGDATLVAPALAIETVAAGGGSVCGIDDHGRLFVGPQSAGAHPGPACYGAGGPLTVTDCNLLLARLDASSFELPLDADAAHDAAQAVVARVAALRGERIGLESLLAAFLDLADEHMAAAIRTISVGRGYDPAEHALLAFGGAAGQHVAAVARRLHIQTVVLPPDGALLSAAGLGAAARERFAERELRGSQTVGQVASLCAQLEAEARTHVVDDGAAPERVSVVRRIARLHLKGQDSSLEIELPDDRQALDAAFRARYGAVFGTEPDPQRPIEWESLRVVAREEPESVGESGPQGEPASLPHETRIFIDGAWRAAMARPRSSLAVGVSVAGPLRILERHSVTIVPPGWTVSVAGSGALVLMDGADPPTSPAPAGPASLELFARRVESIAEEMGETLRRTAVSVNIKERLDYSCAVLDADGALLATAAHIPVHLGALQACVQRLTERFDLRPDESWITNHPAYGGSHLPDVTVVTPVFLGGERIGFTASRAHHAEIGGTRPGSMPPGARSLAEEGVVLAPQRWNPQALARVLADPPFPSRAVADNLSDVAAAIAANRRGAASLEVLAVSLGPGGLSARSAALSARCQAIARAALGRAMEPGERRVEERLDDGARIVVTVRAESSGVSIDFTGTDAVQMSNLNAPLAVTQACVLYVLRLLIAQPVPLNAGLLQAIALTVPERCLLHPAFVDDPAHCPAVVGGNTETSQRVVQALVRAFDLGAGAQGTMNNVLFGTDDFGYYETVCGGAGATATRRGESAVHTHMTNTRITDPEVLETRYPVRLERFAIRQGSGGNGRNHGGDGVVREIRFLRPMALSLLTQGRRSGGCGAHGGAAGQPGTQTWIGSDGAVRHLPGIAAVDVEAGDRLILETPGGGGWGDRQCPADR
jgi:5-oxoprolinase (ATP-hydrolysing)